MALFDLAKIKATIDELEAKQNEPNFWNDQKRAVKIVNELNNNKDIYTSFNNIKNNFKDLSDLLKTLKDCFVMDWFPKSAPQSATEPADPSKFDAWVDTSDEPAVKRYYDGENWKEYQTLSTKISNITIGEAMGTEYDDASPLMQKLWNYKPSELSTAIDNLKKRNIAEQLIVLVSYNLCHGICTYQLL